MIAHRTRQWFVRAIGQGYSPEHRNTTPYTTTLFTSYDYSLQLRKAVRSHQRAIATKLKARV